MAEANPSSVQDEVGVRSTTDDKLDLIAKLLQEVMTDKDDPKVERIRTALEQLSETKNESAEREGSNATEESDDEIFYDGQTMDLTNNSESESTTTSSSISSGIGDGFLSRFCFQGKEFVTKYQGNGKFGIHDASTGKWIFRLDKPHAGHQYNHVNVNPKVSGLGYDPHLPIGGGEGTLMLAQNSMKLMSYVNKAIIAAAVVYNGYMTAVNAKKDYDLGTTRNTAECVTDIAGGVGGGTAGAYAGAMLGTALLPGVGTFFGGLIGGIAGGIGGSIGATAAASAAFDWLNYDKHELFCVNCQQGFCVRLYKGEIEQCPFCKNGTDYVVKMEDVKEILSQKCQYCNDIITECKCCRK